MTRIILSYLLKYQRGALHQSDTLASSKTHMAKPQLPQIASGKDTTGIIIVVAVVAVAIHSGIASDCIRRRKATSQSMPCGFLLDYYCSICFPIPIFSLVDDEIPENRPLQKQDSYCFSQTFCSAGAPLAPNRTEA
jgi:hypothetical protein